MQGWMRAFWRFFYFVIKTSQCIILFLILVLFGTPKKKAGVRVRRKWLTEAPGVMGFRLACEGEPARQTCLFVGNHISYIDPVAVLFYFDANVVAKAEIKRWPLIGWGSHLVGTIFVKREEKSSRQETALAIRTALEEGVSILVFPEGTTTAGPLTLPFKPRSFAAAHDAGVPVQPIAIIYDSPLVAYIGEDTFLPHFFRVFRLKAITGRIAFGPLLYGENTAREAQDWINNAQTHYHPSTHGNP